MSTQPPWQRPPAGEPPQPPQPPPAQPPPAEPPPAQAPAAQPPPTQAPAAPAAPPQPAPPGPAQAPPPPGPGAPAPPLPPVHAPPPGGPGGKGKTKLIVAVVAAVAILGIGGAVVAVAGGRDQPERGPGPSNGNGEKPDPPPRDPARDHEESELRSLLQDTAGPYTLVAAEQNPDAISAGAVDAYFAKYEGQGVQLVHDLIAWSSPDEAVGQLEAVATGMAEEGFAVGEPQPYTNEADEQIGVIVPLLNEQQGVEALGWTNGSILAVALGPVDSVEPFFQAVPY